MKQIVIEVPDEMLGFVKELLGKLNLTVSGGSDVFDLLTPNEQQRLDTSISQADAGKVISHKDLMEEARRWISK